MMPSSEVEKHVDLLSANIPTETHLCIVIDRVSRMEITSYEITINPRFQDERNARHIARIKFEQELKDQPLFIDFKKVDWAIDSCRL